MPIELPTHLLEAVVNRKCVLFVGSGLSAAAGYPTWGGLITTLVNEAKKSPGARIRGIERYVEEKDYFTLAEFARSALAPGLYADLLRKLLGRPVIPTHSHEVIANTTYRGLITTNYDKLLETTFTMVRNWTPIILKPESIDTLASALYNQEFFIFKLHGDIDSPRSVVLTGSDYDGLILRNPQVRSFLQAVFLNFTLLFVGYSLHDPDFQLVLSELTLIFEGYTPMHYALIADAGEFEVDHLLKRMNIQAISYSAKDEHREAVQLLERLQQEAPFVPTNLP